MIILIEKTSINSKLAKVLLFWLCIYNKYIKFKSAQLVNNWWYVDFLKLANENNNFLVIKISIRARTPNLIWLRSYIEITK